MRKFGFLLLLLGNVMWFAACGGSGGGSNSPHVTSVNVSCTPNPVGSGGSAQCTASVSGTGSFNSAVTWSTSAGSISSSGVLTAPTVAGTSTPGGGGTSNVQPLVVDAGPQPQTFSSVNEAFVTVTVCAPGTSNCQTIDHIQVDTGSEGLRLLAGVLNSASVTVTATSVQDTSTSGSATVTATLLPLSTTTECLLFADGYVWGPVGAADISFNGATAEVASASPVQVLLPSTSTPAVPTSCSNQNPSGGNGNEGVSVMAFGANGILGIGPFQNDCGAYCALQGSSCNGTSSAPCVYYICTPSGCSAANLPIVQQLPNPIVLFANDNNGALIQLPSVPNGGSLNVNGSLIFGINTQSNNQLSLAASLYQIPDQGNNAGNIITVFNGQSYPQSFLDSGSNGLFFLDSNTTGIPTCSGNLSSWYCPNQSPDQLMATNQGQNNNGPVGSQVPVTFSIEDTTNLFNTSNTAFSTLGGPNPGAFDFGLSFFFGKNVFTAIDGATVSGAPSGPFFAY